MVFHGLWLPWSFNVASWFFCWFPYISSFTVFHGFSLFLVVFYFVPSKLYGFSCYGLLNNFDGIFIIVLCSVIFQGIQFEHTPWPLPATFNLKILLDTCVRLSLSKGCFRPQPGLSHSGPPHPPCQQCKPCHQCKPYHQLKPCQQCKICKPCQQCKQCQECLQCQQTVSTV